MKIVVALFIYAITVAASVWLDRRILRPLCNNPVTTWLALHLYRPGLRAATVVIFIAAGWPDIYGLHDVPALGVLAGANAGQAGSLQDLLWILTLGLPLFPDAARMPALIVPLQAAATVAFFFHWLAERLGLTIHYWPGMQVALHFALVAILGHVLGRIFARLAAPRFSGSRWRAVYYEAMMMALQVPAIIIYAHSLGAQLHVQ